MTTAVYLRDVEGQQALCVFDGDITLTEVRNELERNVLENNMILDDYLVSTTRGDWFYNNLEQVAQEVLEWSEYRD